MLPLQLLLGDVVPGDLRLGEQFLMLHQRLPVGRHELGVLHDRVVLLFVGQEDVLLLELTQDLALVIRRVILERALPSPLDLGD